MKRARRVDGSAELDVIPVLSLIVHLIPMLLLGVRFVTLAQVPVDGPPVPTVPARDRGQFEAQERAVVSVRITRSGFAVGGLLEATAPLSCAQAPCAIEAYPYAELARALADAKDGRTGDPVASADGRIVVAPDADVPYEVVVRVMDTARARKAADGRETPLFPQPVLASPPPEGGR